MNAAAPRLGKAVDTAAAAQQAADAGFDYAAITMEYIMGGDDEQFILQKNLFGQCRLIPEVCLSVLPAGAVVTAPGFNLYHWLDYLKQALRRLADIGCHTLLWRDGAARALPLEGDETAARAQCLQFIYMLCRLCKEYGIAVMVEPLSVSATNHLNTLSEVEAFIAQVNKDNLHPAISWADAAELCGDIKPADIAARVRHICAETLPMLPAVPVLQSAGGHCSITLLDDADKESLRKARRLLNA